MEEEVFTDFDKVARDCGLYNGTSADKIVNNIEKVRITYDIEKFVFLCNYLLGITNDPDILMYLIRCCDEYRHPSSLDVLTDLLLLKSYSEEERIELKEKFYNVRMMCAKAIGNYKNSSSVSALLYCLNDKNEHYRVRFACADALGRIGDKFAVTPLIEIVKDEEEKSVYLKESVTSALGLLGDTRAVDPLLSIIETKQGILNKFSFLKERAIEALRKLGLGADERLFKALKESLADESAQVRIDAIEALMDSEHPKAYETIKHCMMDDSDDEVKKNALIALYNMSDRKILDEVISSREYSDTLKVEAVNILSEYETGDEV